MMFNNRPKNNRKKFGRFKDFGNLLRNLDWEHAREQVNQESRSRVLLLGLAGAGKSTLFNAICGWQVSGSEPEKELVTEPVEDYGLFCLIDLPKDMSNASGFGIPVNGQMKDYYWSRETEFRPYEDLMGTIPLGALEPLELAEGADLLIYVLDGLEGVRAADYRWLSRLRRLGLPLLVVLNKCDMIEAPLNRRQAEIEGRLATMVLPVSALHGDNIRNQLLPKMLSLCPKLTVALGRELGDFRRRAAERLINQAALINGLVGLEPVPLLDLPVQALTITGMLLRISAIYHRPPGDTRRREVWLAVTGGLAGRYGAQQLAKFVPVVGWLVSGIVGWVCTWSLGRAVMVYFEAGGDDTISQTWRATHMGVKDVCQRLLRTTSHWHWPAWPRLKKEMSTSGRYNGVSSVEADRNLVRYLTVSSSVETPSSDTADGQ